MDLLCLNPDGLVSKISALSDSLSASQAKIAALISKPCSDSDSPASRHIQLEELRFERNTIRSRILDATKVLEALEARDKTKVIIEYFSTHMPGEYAEIIMESGSGALPSSHLKTDTQVLQQSLEHYYRKLESSHQDQVSMMTQIHLNSLTLARDDDWLSRINFALSKSQAYFVRKCTALRSVRDQIAQSLRDHLAEKHYHMILARYGNGFVDGILLSMESAKKKAA